MNRTLFSLAIIRTNWDIYRKDYIENFVPLYATLIKKKEYPEILIDNIDIIKDDFKNEYGLFIPSNPTITILNRLTKKKLLRKESGNFFPVKENLEKINISARSREIVREFEHVIEYLKNFIKEKHDLEFSKEELENALIGYLKKHDLDLLFAAERNSLLPNIHPDKKLQYLINEFIGNAFRAEPQLFKFIVNLTIGHALSSTILFNDFKQYSGKFKGLNLFLDTPFVFNLIGINGIHKKSLAQELVTILLKEGVKLYVLEITNSEVLSNLEEALNLLEKGKNDPSKGPITFRACLENGFNISDVEQFILDLPDIYDQNGINKNEIPSYYEFEEFQIDENKLYDTIIDAYSFKEKQECKSEEETNVDKEEKINNTILRDVKVLSGIYRYRLGNTPKTLKDCKYLFITTNSSLAYASRMFEKKENGNKYSLPTCLTDVFLGTLIWLHSPTQIETLSEKKIIADCFAALEPDEKLIAKYLDDVDKLKAKGQINEEKYILLRTHRAAINILENKTFGDIKEYTPDITEEVLQELIDKLKSEELEKYKKEQQDHEETQKQLSYEQQKLLDAQGLLEKEEQEKIQKELNRKKNVKKKAEIKAKRWIISFQTILITLLVLSGVILIAERFALCYISNWLLNVSWIILTISGVLNIVSGFNIIGLRKKIFIKFANYYESKIYSRIKYYES